METVLILLGNFIQKIVDNPEDIVTVWLQLDQSTDRFENDIAQYLWEEHIPCHVQLAYTYDQFMDSVNRLEFLFENDSKIQFLITYFSNDVENEDTITYLNSTLEKLYTLDDIRLFIHAPSLLNDNMCQEIRNSNINSIISTDADITSATLREKLQLYTSSATLLWYDDSPSDSLRFELEIANNWRDCGVQIIMVSGKEEFESYLWKNRKYLNSSPAFRILIAVSETCAYMDLLFFVRKTAHIKLAPILLWSPNKKLIKESTYVFKRTAHSGGFEHVSRYSLMKPLIWAPNLWGGVIDYPEWNGEMHVLKMSCWNLAPKDSNGFSDPYIVVKTNSITKKSNKILKTLNPVWELHDKDMKFPCSASDTITVDVWDYDRMSKDDYNGGCKFSVKSILMEVPDMPLKFLSKTYALLPKISKKHSSLDRRRKKDIITGTVTIEMVLYTDKGETIEKHFGKPIEESLHNAEHDGIVHLIYKSIEALMQERALLCTGLFRIPGNNERVFNLRHRFDEGNDITLLNEDPYDVAGLLKLYFYELPDSILPQEYFFEAANLVEPVNIETMKDILNNIPSTNYEILKLLIRYFTELANNSDQNKMSPSVIGISAGSSILVSTTIRDDAVLFMKASNLAPPLMAMLISEYNSLFL
eukprot:TRINITY_DN1849_c0_g1_i4.p1 TRINITY_DN1849_c0_g1~~TRINITY_DN1849_c0_g1_i4.p1  ORF type:complete len:644 (-),score=130.11 TRINITY_DN1849_c0_g1_i4:868-2799(-)